MAELARITVEPREPPAAEVSRRLIDYLMSGEVRPGDRVPSERQLTEMPGVNRSTVREAITSPGFLGLLEIRQSSGTYFRGTDSHVLYRLFELGLVLGGRGARDMVQARTRTSGEADTAFHAALAEPAANTVLRDMLKGMRAVIQRGWVQRTGAVRSRDVAYADHLPVFEAVAEGNAEAAREATARHMDGASRRLMEALEQRQGQGVSGRRGSG